MLISSPRKSLTTEISDLFEGSKTAIYEAGVYFDSTAASVGSYSFVALSGAILGAGAAAAIDSFRRGGQSEIWHKLQTRKAKLSAGAGAIAAVGLAYMTDFEPKQIQGLCEVTGKAIMGATVGAGTYPVLRTWATGESLRENFSQETKLGAKVAGAVTLIYNIVTY